MGLREFLMGAQQGSEGATQFAKTAQEMRQQAASKDLAAQLPGLSEKFRMASPEEQGRISGEIGGQDILAGGTKNPMIEQIAKLGFGSTTSDVLTPDQLVSTYGLSPEKAQAIGSLKTQKAQQAALGYGQKETLAKTKEAGVQGRFEESLGERKTTRGIKNYADFNKDLEGAEVKFEDASKGLASSLAQFKKNPNKGSLQQLAVSMARAGGDTGVLSNMDMAAYKLSTMPQEIKQMISWAYDLPEDAITPSVQKALTNMAEFGLSQSEKRKEDRLKNLFKNNVSIYGKEFLKGEKPDVLKNWEKRLGMEASIDKSGVSVGHKARTFTGKANDVMSAAIATKNKKVIDAVSSKLNQLPEGKDIGDKAESALMDYIKKGAQ